MTNSRIIRATKPPTSPSDKLPREVLGRPHRRGNVAKLRRSRVVNKLNRTASG
jgi:hypothetical protein